MNGKVDKKVNGKNPTMGKGRRNPFPKMDVAEEGRMRYVHDAVMPMWVEEEKGNGKVRFWDPLAGSDGPFVEVEREKLFPEFKNAKGSGGVPYFTPASGKEPMKFYGKGGVYNSGERNYVSKESKERSESSY